MAYFGPKVFAVPDYVGFARSETAFDIPPRVIPFPIRATL